MRYDKHALTFEQQADLLLQRGLQADRDILINRLRVVIYYRLSGYLFPFRDKNDHFRPETTLDTVWRRYTFDRRLRILALDAIERVEVALRTQVVYEHVHRYGPFGYTVPENLPKLDGNRFGQFLSRVYDETQRSREIFVQHFRTKYSDQHPYLPLWMAAEIMPFGVMFNLYTGVEPNIKRDIALIYNVPDIVLSSWVNVLNTVRNICAHHGRLWNRELGVKPLMPNIRKYPKWHKPVTIPNHRIFAVLTILQYMTCIVAPQSHWHQRLHSLLDEYPDIPRLSMGFPERWEASPLWE